MQRFEADMKIGVKKRLFCQPSVDSGATPEGVDGSDARIKVGHVPWGFSFEGMQDCFGHRASAPTHVYNQLFLAVQISRQLAMFERTAMNAASKRRAMRSKESRVPPARGRQGKPLQAAGSGLATDAS